MSARDLTNHAVIIASMGRPDVLRDTLVSLQNQTVAPGLIILSVTSQNDLPCDIVAPEMKVIIGDRGSSVQRNAGIEQLPRHIEIVSFLDDDVELDPHYLETVHTFLADHSEHVLIDGLVVIDGDVTRCDAVMSLYQDEPAPNGFINSVNAYGCNMTVRRLVAEEVRFDERLKLYAWLEDADFSRRCLKYGLCAQVLGARLVHLRATTGRISGRRFGFAQITNSYYLKTKGQMSITGLLFNHWAPALCSNAWGALRRNKDERSGRLYGNLIAIKRILSGRCEPEYIDSI